MSLEWQLSATPETAAGCHGQLVCPCLPRGQASYPWAPARHRICVGLQARRSRSRTSARLVRAASRRGNRTAVRGIATSTTARPGPALPPNVTEHRAATIDSALPIRPTSPLQCIGLFAAHSERSVGRMLPIFSAHRASRRRYCRRSPRGSADGRREVHQGSGYGSSSSPPRNSIGVQITIPDRPSSSSNR